MSYTEKHIVETYINLFEGLSSLSKIELIENLSKSLRAGTNRKDDKFYKSFGAFSSEKTAEELVGDIKSSTLLRREQSIWL